MTKAPHFSLRMTLPLTLAMLVPLIATWPEPAASAGNYGKSWSAACMSEGRHSQVPLSTSDRMFMSATIPSYARTMAGMGGPSASATRSKICSCMGRRLAGHGGNAGNSFDALTAAFKGCE